jgi:hypothetical protein
MIWSSSRFLFRSFANGFKIVPLITVLMLLSAMVAQAQLSKGHQILIDRGLQLQALAQDDCYMTLSKLTNANYTSVGWVNSPGAHSSRPDWIGPAPGYLWARWASDQTQMPPQVTPYGGDETPMMSQLFALQLGDEWPINDDTKRNELVNWFTAVRTNYPNTILFHSSWGGQIGDGALADFYTRALPDMLNFDTYPWKSVYDTNQPDHVGAPISGPPTSWYGDLRRYRAHAQAAQIPFGAYRQTFHAVEEYEPYNVYRDPSPSELRLNTFGALAFNAKFITDFIYNTGAASLFTKTFNGSGDTQLSTNGLYAEITDVNKRAINLGRALIALKPVYDLHNTNVANFPNGFPPGPGSNDPNFPLGGYTTSIMFLRGKYLSGGVTNFTAVPNSLLADPDVAGSNPAGTGQAYTWWESDKNDPYLRGWVVTNSSSVKNSGLLGDAILAWFTPLDEAFDGITYSNQIYMMVVNGLTSPDGTASNCLQQIRLNFVDTAATTSILMLNPLTGLVTTNVLPVVNTRRQLSVDLAGGDAVLFKFNTGAPFVGHVPPIAARLTAARNAGQTAITLQGTLGSRYEVQSSASLSSPNWTRVKSTLLSNSSWSFTDTTTTNSNLTFYRAVGIP